MRPEPCLERVNQDDCSLGLICLICSCCPTHCLCGPVCVTCGFVQCECDYRMERWVEHSH